MYLVLKAEYTVINEEEFIISHLFEELHRSIKVSSNIDKELLVQKLLYGFSMPKDKKALSQEEKLMIMLSKQLEELIFLTEDEFDYRREINIRGVLLAANKSGVEHSIIKDYYDTFHDQKIYTLDDNQELINYFKREGLSQIIPISRENIASLHRGSILLINEKNLPYVQSVKDNKYLVYSLDKLRLGPLLVPGTTICLKCYYNNYTLINNVENGYPIYYRNFILNFLVNTVYFCLNDLHKSLGTDVGLPIRKCYQLANPQLSVSVMNIYKTSDCSLCFQL
ncbi:hypothetical protein H8S33_16085 [Ornithinibacillus sp. BX22]|uniref:Uncharacterized protein n=1 Tax=Ornithinibacillus hominis TaxID=2763055 RepID=A0A923RJV9_9BACI|nr:hypothetical protein [Ornithinibacillus hominis]MBC5638301.1 hypothetical protein [Ornithinibacillus hominis]